MYVLKVGPRYLSSDLTFTSSQRQAKRFTAEQRDTVPALGVANLFGPDARFVKIVPKVRASVDSPATPVSQP